MRFYVVLFGLTVWFLCGSCVVPVSILPDVAGRLPVENSAGAVPSSHWGERKPMAPLVVANSIVVDQSGRDDFGRGTFVEKERGP